MYLNTFSFETGFPPATEQEISTLYSYLEDPVKGYITRAKFQGFLSKCLGLYAEAKREPIGGILDRLVLMVRN